MDRQPRQKSGCSREVFLNGGSTVFSNPQYSQIVLCLFLLVLDTFKWIQIVFTSDLNHQRINQKEKQKKKHLCMYLSTACRGVTFEWRCFVSNTGCIERRVCCTIHCSTWCAIRSYSIHACCRWIGVSTAGTTSCPGGTLSFLKFVCKLISRRMSSDFSCFLMNRNILCQRKGWILLNLWHEEITIIITASLSYTKYLWLVKKLKLKRSNAFICCCCSLPVKVKYWALSNICTLLQSPISWTYPVQFPAPPNPLSFQPNVDYNKLGLTLHRI